jgi:ribonuclease HI
MVYVMKFDGCCNPNPGEMGLGIVVWNEDDKKVMEISERAGFGTNNQAEYRALIRGLEELSTIYKGVVLVLGDSQLVIHQMNGQWDVRSKELRPLFTKAQELEKNFEKISYQWLDREENKEADLLSARAVGIEGTRKKDIKIPLEAGSSYEFTFDDDSKFSTYHDDRFNRDVKRYFVSGAVKDGKKINGNYFDTGAKKLNEKLDYYSPLKGKKFRIISTKAKRWIEYMVEELEE